MTASVLLYRLIIGPDPFKTYVRKQRLLPSRALRQLSWFHRAPEGGWVTGTISVRVPLQLWKTGNKLITSVKLSQKREGMIHRLS